jgi:hypothetical protein
VRVAVAYLERCEIAGKERVCFPLDDKPQVLRTDDGRQLAAVRNL